MKLNIPIAVAFSVTTATALAVPAVPSTDPNVAHLDVNDPTVPDLNVTDPDTTTGLNLTEPNDTGLNFTDPNVTDLNITVTNTSVVERPLSSKFWLWCGTERATEFCAHYPYAYYCHYTGAPTWLNKYPYCQQQCTCVQDCWAEETLITPKIEICIAIGKEQTHS